MAHLVSRFTSGITLMLILFVVCFSRIEIVAGEDVEIVIASDGSVTGTDRIQQHGSTYVFTGDVNATLDVKKSDIVIDGRGYTLQDGNSALFGIDLNYVVNVTVKNFNVIGFSYGIDLHDCSYCTLSNINVSNSRTCGITLYSSSYNNLTGNTIVNSGGGISLGHRSGSNFLRNNLMGNNTSNFDVSPVFYLYSYDLVLYHNDIDTSNLIDGKPIYYWINKDDLVVPSDAGYVALVNCDNVTVQNLDLSRNNQGILLACTIHSTITGNTITNTYNGVHLSRSIDNIVTGNTVKDNSNGIVLSPDSKSNIVFGNTIADNQLYGIMTCWNSQKNSFYENVIKNNTSGVYVWRAQYNNFSKNTVVDNRQNGIMCLNDPCNDNTFSENNITSNDCGICISVPSNVILGNDIACNNYGIILEAPNSILKNNKIHDNNYSFDALSAGASDIDTSNTINAKPIYYWVDQQNKTVPSDAGYVCLVNCAQIVVENLTLSKNVHSVLLVNTIDSTIAGNTLSENLDGIQLYRSSNNTITANTCFNNSNSGVAVTEHSTENKVFANTFDAGGIFVLSSSNNHIFENTVTGKCNGIVITESSYNVLTDNNLTDTVVGITIHASEDNLLRNNRMERNEWNFKVEGTPYANEVASSNTVDGKPIYYLVNEKDCVVPSDAGYVCLISCENITVQNCTLMKNQQGVLLAYSFNSTIVNNSMASNTFGIQLYQSSGINITSNLITSNLFGIELWGDSQHCDVLQNCIAFNGQGVYFSSVGNSTFLGNSFENNTQHVAAHYYATGIYQNIWDNGSAGNFWSNYNGTDNDGNGVGDLPYIINERNQDNYPLMEPVVIPEFPSWTPLLILLAAVFAATVFYKHKMREIH